MFYVRRSKQSPSTRDTVKQYNNYDNVLTLGLKFKDRPYNLGKVEYE
jgi:hypothetical protein